MAAGFAFALSEISLVLFTTLAPSGAVAFALMGAPLHRAALDADARERISKLLCIPLIVTMVGLVASATHLGHPDNALYVIAGIGRSPLSTEVAGAVVFDCLRALRAGRSCDPSRSGQTKQVASIPFMCWRRVRWSATSSTSWKRRPHR